MHTTVLSLLSCSIFKPSFSSLLSDIFPFLHIHYFMLASFSYLLPSSFFHLPHLSFSIIISSLPFFSSSFHCANSFTYGCIYYRSFSHVAFIIPSSSLSSFPLPLPIILSLFLVYSLPHLYLHIFIFSCTSSPHLFLLISISVSAPISISILPISGFSFYLLPFTSHLSLYTFYLTSYTSHLSPPTFIVSPFTSLRTPLLCVCFIFYRTLSIFYLSV